MSIAFTFFLRKPQTPPEALKVQPETVSQPLEPNECRVAKIARDRLVGDGGARARTRLGGDRRRGMIIRAGVHDFVGRGVRVANVRPSRWNDRYGASVEPSDRLCERGGGNNR